MKLLVVNQLLTLGQRQEVELVQPADSLIMEDDAVEHDEEGRYMREEA